MTLYALRPDPATGSLDDAEVVSQSKYGWQSLEQAIELWRLVSIDRASEIEAVMDRIVVAAGDREPRIEPRDLSDLFRLLTGLEDALVSAGIVDEQWRVPADRLGALSAHVPGINLAAERSLEDKTYALGEVMSNAIFLRNFLAKAVEASCVVVIG
jgi:hypothetical protein